MNQQQQSYGHLLSAVGGLLVGAWWVKNENEDAQKSRAEREDGEGVEEVCEAVAPVLDAWEPHDQECEDDYTADLFEHLRAECLEDEDCCVEDVYMCPNTREGQPDILIDDHLVLELKVNPNKSERDRLIGQCAGYSREWVTWIVLIDTPQHKVRELETLLKDKGLERILVFSFS
jgi:hypothetical protein